MARKKLVVIGFLGTQLDAGKGPNRWERWRPTVSICQHEELIVDRLELLSSPRYASLARTITDALGRVSPETEVVPRSMPLADPWDLEEVYGALHDFARAYPFEPAKE